MKAILNLTNKYGVEMNFCQQKFKIIICGDVYHCYTHSLIPPKKDTEGNELVFK